MKKLPQLSLSLFLLILCISACEEEMPEPNEWRILKWTVDGERHKASCESQGLFGCTALDVSYNLNNGSFAIGGGTDVNGFTSTIYIYIYRSLKIKEPILLDTYDRMVYKKRDEPAGCNEYKAINKDQRLLYISEIDSTNRIIEGYYEFEGINDCQDTLQIKDGYFKVSF